MEELNLAHPKQMQKVVMDFGGAVHQQHERRERDRAPGNASLFERGVGLDEWGEVHVSQSVVKLSKQKRDNAKLLKVSLSKYEARKEMETALKQASLERSELRAELEDIGEVGHGQ